MQLSEKPNTFSQFFVAFLESRLNFKHFEKQWASYLKYFWDIDSERRAYLNA